jgi:DNA-binding transcriptional ArsR family regulator
MDGCAWTAGELAAHTQTSAQAMSSCLQRLADAGVISRMHQGRHQYVHLANEHIAQVIEFLGNAVPPTPTAPVGYRQVRADQRLRYARSCYNHIAGNLGVRIADSMLAAKLIDLEDHSMRLTPQGLQWFNDQGIALVEAGRTPRIKACLDWTERRFHVGGKAGSAMLAYCIDQHLLLRASPKRALRFTPEGRQWFARTLDIRVEDPTRVQAGAQETQQAS